MLTRLNHSEILPQHNLLLSHSTCHPPNSFNFQSHKVRVLQDEKKPDSAGEELQDGSGASDNTDCHHPEWDFRRHPPCWWRTVYLSQHNTNTRDHPTPTVPMTTKRMRGIDSGTRIPMPKDVNICVQLQIPLNYLGGHRFSVGVRWSYLWTKLQHWQTTWRDSWKVDSDRKGSCLRMADTGRRALLYMGSKESQGSTKSK